MDYKKYTHERCYLNDRNDIANNSCMFFVPTSEDADDEKENGNETN